MKAKLLTLILLLLSLTSFSQDLIIPWKANSGIYQIANPSTYKKLIDINYKTYFKQNKDGSKDLNDITYFINIGDETYCNLYVNIAGKNVSIDIVYRDNTFDKISLPFDEFTGSKSIYVFKSVGYTKQTVVFIHEVQGISIVDIPITFMNKKYTLHLLPVTI